MSRKEKKKKKKHKKEKKKKKPAEEEDKIMNTDVQTEAKPSESTKMIPNVGLPPSGPSREEKTEESSRSSLKVDFSPTNPLRGSLQRRYTPRTMRRVTLGDDSDDSDEDNKEISSPRNLNALSRSRSPVPSESDSDDIPQRRRKWKKKLRDSSTEEEFGQQRRWAAKHRRHRMDSD